MPIPGRHPEAHAHSWICPRANAHSRIVVLLGRVPIREALSQGKCPSWDLSWGKCPSWDCHPRANAHSRIIILPGRVPIRRASSQGRCPSWDLSWGKCPFSDLRPGADAHLWSLRRNVVNEADHESMPPVPRLTTSHHLSSDPAT